MPDQATQSRRTPEQIQADLKRLREEDPHGYARSAARLLKELERARGKRPKYART